MSYKISRMLFYLKVLEAWSRTRLRLRSNKTMLSEILTLSSFYLPPILKSTKRSRRLQTIRESSWHQLDLLTHNSRPGTSSRVAQKMKRQNTFSDLMPNQKLLIATVASKPSCKTSKRLQWTWWDITNLSGLLYRNILYRSLIMKQRHWLRLSLMLNEM